MGKRKFDSVAGAATKGGGDSEGAIAAVKEASANDKEAKEEAVAATKGAKGDEDMDLMDPVSAKHNKYSERSGELQFRIVSNDGSRDNLIALICAKCIIAQQLPKMPREYIARLVLDRNLRKLPFGNHFQRTSQGYGTRLMNELKEVAKQEGLTHFLTYADNFAIGYFKKQGFTKEVTMDRHRWVGYIKDYDGGTLMESVIYSSIDYRNVPSMLRNQRIRILDLLRKRAAAAVEKGRLEQTDIESEDLDPEELERKETGASGKRHKTMAQCAVAATALIFRHPDSWPFHEPVTKKMAEDYHKIVTNPIDLTTILNKAKDDQYRSIKQYSEDLKLMIDNCRLYNKKSSKYYACASRLEVYIETKVIPYMHAELQED